jgi:hypothetical protein
MDFHVAYAAQPFYNILVGSDEVGVLNNCAGKIKEPLKVFKLQIIAGCNYTVIIIL